MIDVTDRLHYLADREMLRAVELNNTANPNDATMHWHRQNAYEAAAAADPVEPTPYTFANILVENSRKTSNHLNYTATAVLILAAVYFAVRILL